jgi:UDP-2,3-diacylglucosamine hydrolase
MDRIGLIAGNRRFPLLVAQGARSAGVDVMVIAIKGETSASICRFARSVHWLALKDFSRMFEIFKQEGISRAIMAGQISPRRLFSAEVLQDPALKKILCEIRNKKADTIFGAIAGRMQDEGISLLDSSLYVKEHVPDEGILTSGSVPAAVMEDIKFGFDLAKSVAGLDIGQTVAVKEKAIVAVEAFEGTDNLIRRAGRLLRGITVVKVSKPNQDMRFDIPVVGIRTIQSLIAARAAGLAIEAGKTLFIDREKAVALAQRQGICVVSYSRTSS